MIAVQNGLCTDFFITPLDLSYVFVKLLGVSCGAALFGLTQHFDHSDMTVERQSEDIARFQRVARFCHSDPVQAHIAAFDELRGKGAMFYKAGINQPFIKALGQLFLHHGCS